MQKTIQFVRKYPFSALCLILIWVLSLTPVFPETPLDGVKFMDKWTHLAMYGGTTAVIWLEYQRRHKRTDGRLWLVTAGMVALGGVIELLQAYATTARSGEWLDFLSDSLGVLLGVLAALAVRTIVR